MVVLEAMSTGLPVISTTVEGIPEVVREGREGLLVAPDSVKDIAEAIRKVVDGSVDLAATGESGLQRQRDHFSDVSMAKGVVAVYQELLR
jgi:glycosyltransferase involved in cell wall biosynthesis